MASTKALSVEEVWDAALALPAEDRYHLMLWLQQSIPPGIPEEGYDEAIKAMLDERLADIDAGRVTLLTPEGVVRVSISPAAARDVREIRRWLRRERPSVEDDFLRAWRGARRLASEHPLAGQVHQGTVRRIPFTRLPYDVLSSS
jgi:putative addiction module component (TIGR02574 family)